MRGWRSRLEGNLLTADVLLAAGALVVLAASALFSPGGLPFLPLCPFRQWTGFSCPGCGITRAFCAISHGDFASAWSFNPFGFVFYIAVLAVAAWPLVKRVWPGIGSGVLPSGMLVLAPILLVALMWVFGICRFVSELRARWG